MALVSIVNKEHLAFPLILAPERYDPRRQINVEGIEIVELGEIVISVKKTVKPSADLGKTLIIDTSDACEGIVTCRKEAILGTQIGSTKKVVFPKDIIISRLRPYLRQVAYVDDKISEAQNAKILCSTEFFVLRSRNDESIAFLAPFLLSQPVQKILCASQEGGHHPRVNESTLLTLPVPKEILLNRTMISKSVMESVSLYRQSEKIIYSLIKQIEGNN